MRDVRDLILRANTASRRGYLGAEFPARCFFPCGKGAEVGGGIRPVAEEEPVEENEGVGEDGAGQGAAGPAGGVDVVVEGEEGVPE
ncbi:hypothetical protein G7Y89_g8492 [Cudoniella acicularis]|uniref:Uncharacterized protein n=1 Tax=Cudoniella acicularis TaxID=354080 RepID=A0A8H4W108_9HELO|nr:hypothetical protein G7Y89_g8492 [Cudoniella acicularis]